MATLEVDILAADALAEGAVIGIKAAQWHVLLARRDGTVFAMNDRCPHAASRLSGGRLRQAAIMCPRHGARFELANGRCIGNSYPPVRTFPVREADGRIWVTLPEHGPDLSEMPIG